MAPTPAAGVGAGRSDDMGIVSDAVAVVGSGGVMPDVCVWLFDLVLPPGAGEVASRQLVPCRRPFAQGPRAETPPDVARPIRSGDAFVLQQRTSN